MTSLDLLTEATALPYRSYVSNKKAKSDDIFIFGDFLLKVSTLSRGVTLYYLKNHTPCLFVLSGYNEATGVVQRNINSLPQAQQVVATIAEIISKELGDNTRTPVALVRIPANGIKAEVVTRIIQRYVRKTSPKFEVTGVVLPDGSRFQYIMIQRKDVDIDMDKVFGVGDKLQLRSVVSLPTPSDDVNKAFEKVDAQIKAKTPNRIDITTISGGRDITDLPSYVRDFMTNNPSPIDRMSTGEVKPTEFDPVEEIFPSGILGKSKNTPLPIKPTCNTLKSAYSKVSEYTFDENEISKQEYAKMVDEFEVWLADNNVTLMDVFDGSDSLKRLDDKIGQLIDCAIPSEKERPYEKQRILGSILNTGLFNPHMLHIHESYEDFPGDIAEEFIPIIKKYCSNTFETVNNYLLNGEIRTTEQDQVENTIKELDRAFVESSSQLPDDTILYRSMKFPDWLFLETIDDKLFHFRTYVSTSFSPYMGLTFNGQGLTPVVGCEYITSSDEIDSEPMRHVIETSMVIRDVNTVPVIIPGKISGSPRECEVILPRGVTIRINRVAIGRDEIMGKKINSAIMDCSIVDPKDMNESTEVFDGDELFRTGRLVEYRGGFDGFVRGMNIMNEQKKDQNDVANFVKMIQISNLARRSEMTKQELAEVEKSASKFSCDLYSKTRKPRK